MHFQNLFFLNPMQMSLLKGLKLKAILKATCEAFSDG